MIAFITIFESFTASLMSLESNSKRTISVNLLYFKNFCLARIDLAKPIGSFLFNNCV